MAIGGIATIKLQTSVSGSNCCRLLIDESTTIPPNTEVVINGSPSIRLQKGKVVIIEPKTNVVKMSLFS